MKTQIFYNAEKYNLQKKSSKIKIKILLQDIIITLITNNLKFQHKPKYQIIFQKASYQNRPHIIVTSGPKSLKLLLYTL